MKRAARGLAWALGSKHLGIHNGTLYGIAHAMGNGSGCMALYFKLDVSLQDLVSIVLIPGCRRRHGWLCIMYVIYRYQYDSSTKRTVLPTVHASVVSFPVTLNGTGVFPNQEASFARLASRPDCLLALDSQD